VVSIVAEPPLWAVTMTLHTLLSMVPSKSVPITPFEGLEPVGGVAVVVVVAGGVLEETDFVLVVAGGVVVTVVVVLTCKH